MLTFEPQIIERWAVLPDWVGQFGGLALLGLVALYIARLAAAFSAAEDRQVSSSSIPVPPIAARQLCAAPLELFGAAGIIYFALPAAGNPGYFIVLGIFLASFSIALVSHAPGGLGVLEFAFVKAMPDTPPAEVLAALIVFRLLYLIIPLVFALVVVIAFERQRIVERLRVSRRERDHS